MTPLDIDIFGLRLRVWDHGGDGVPVLFLHGFLDTGRSFDLLADRLKPDIRAVCLDFRGHGKSDRVGPGGAYHILDHVKDVARLLPALREQGIDIKTLLGHSMGGNVAFLVAGALPDEVERLILLDALGAPAEKADEQPERLANLLKEKRGALRPFKKVATEDEALERVMATNPGLTKIGAELMLKHSLEELEDGFGFRFDPALRGPNPVRYPEKFWLALCKRVTAKTLVLRAGNGYIPLSEAVSKRLEMIPDSKMLTLDDAHHHLHVDHATWVAEQIRAHAL